MKYPAYPKYRSSGIEWLGDVPEHWVVRRLKTAASYRVSNVDKVPAEDELPVRLCNYTDVYYNDHIRPNMGLMETTATEDEIRRFKLHVGDVVITKDSESWDDIAIPALVVETAPDLICGYHLAIIRADGQNLCGSFIFRAFQACAINQQLQIAASGVTRYGLPKSAIGEAWLPCPYLKEQQSITSFIDTQTAKIDTLIIKKRELIEKLKEKRTALISRTVTRGLPPDEAKAAGLDPNPKLKPSGIDWLGDVPAHWKISKIRYEAELVSKGTTPSTIGKELIDEGIRFLKAENIQDGKVISTPAFFIDIETDAQLARSRLQENDVLIVIAGATTGKTAILQKELIPANANQALCFIRLNNKKYATILAAWISTKLIQDLVWNSAVQAAQPNLAMEDIKAFSCLIPPIEEQIAIQEYLHLESSKIDRMIEKVEQVINKLQEYRSALITAAVTGKIDVREAAA